MEVEIMELFLSVLIELLFVCWIYVIVKEEDDISR